MKTRFTANDVRAEVRDLRSIVLGLRVINVYDVDAKVRMERGSWGAPFPVRLMVLLLFFFFFGRHIC
jgi:hypothetical protein